MSAHERWERAKAHGKPDAPAGVVPDDDEELADPTDDGPPPPKDDERWEGEPPKPANP